MHKNSEWIHFISKDILEKYKDKNPLFIINGSSFPKERALVIMEEYNSYDWLQYKKTTSGYILKPFTPDPPQDICLKTIDTFIENLETTSKVKLFNIVGDTLYNEKEVRQELLTMLMFSFYSKIIIDQISIKKSIIIYKISVVEDTLENMLLPGFAYLEYTDKILSCYKKGGKGFIETSDLE